MRATRTAFAAALLLTASAAFAHGHGGHGAGGCMGSGPGGYAGHGSMCDAGSPNTGAHEKMRTEMFELRRLAAQGATSEAYAEQLKKVEEARREMWAAHGAGLYCDSGFAAPAATK